MRNMSKFGKVSTKVTALALAFVMSLPSASYADEYYGDYYDDYQYEKVNHVQSVIDEAIELGIPNAFIKHTFASDETLGAPTVELTEGEKDPKIKLEKVINSAGKEGLVINKVDTGVLARTKIDLGEYDFAEYKVDRVIYNMLAKKNLKGVAYLYLDDAEKPFAGIKIKRTADENWEATKSLTADVKSAKLSGKHHIYLNFAADNAFDNEGNVIPKTGVKANLYFESMFFTEGSTPVLNFELDNDFANMDEINNSPEHTVEGYGDMHVEIPDGYKSEYTDKKLKSETYELDYIRGRGNSTWLTSKKPYKVKLDSKADLFGMGKNKHWVLLANYYDYTLLRNRFTFDIAKKLGLNYTPDSVCVNLVINGEYYGSYQLCEQIRVGDTRVAINDLEEDPATTEPDITGGYLINMGGSWLKGEEEGVSINTTPYNFVLESPEYDSSYPSEAKEAQVNYIKNYFAIVDKLVNDLEDDEPSNDDIEPTYMPYGAYNDDVDEVDESELNIPEGATWRDYMDEQSLIDYYLIQEYSINGDSYASGSSYLYKPRNDKLYWGPVWDFDFVAWASTDVEVGDEGFKGYAMTERAPWVYKLLKSDAKFRENVVKRWKELKSILDEAIEDGGTLDKMADETYMSALANYQVKKSHLMGDDEATFSGGEGDALYDSEGNLYTLNYYNEINRLKHFIEVRTAWVDETIENILDNGYSYDQNGIKVPAFACREDMDAYENGGDETLVYDYAKAFCWIDEDGGYAYLDSDYMPEDPKKEGYVFDGWYYLDKDGVEHKVDFDENMLQTVEVEGIGMVSYVPYIYAKFISASEAEEIVPKTFEFIEDTFYMNVYKEEWYDSFFNNTEIWFSNNSVYLSDLINYTPYSADPSFIKYDVEVAPEYKNADYELWGDELVVNCDNVELTIIARIGDKEARAKLIVDSDSEKFTTVSGFNVDNNMELNVGESGFIKPTLETLGDGYIDVNELTKFYYTSIDGDVVDVNNHGCIYAKSAGECKVVVARYIDDELKFKVVNVKVVDPNPKKDDNKDDNKDVVKAPAKGSKLADKTFTYKVVKAASDDKKTAGEVAVTGLVKKNAKKATIKSTVKIDGYKYKVTSVANKAFKGAKKLKKVTIGKNVKKIGSKAFYNLKKLKSVTIKSTKITKIGKKAFYKKGKKLTIKVNAKAKKKVKKLLKKAKCKGYKVK